MTASEKVIVFDVDGVLIRNFNEKGEFLWSTNIQHDLGVTGAVMRDIFSAGWLECIKGNADTKTHFQSILDRHGVSLEADDFIDYWLKHDSAFDEDVLACVTALQNNRTFIATNQDRLRTAYLKKAVGHLFEGIFSSSDMGAMKPEDEFFRHVEDTLKISPENIIFIDDLSDNISTAKRRGWSAHLYRDAHELKKVIGLSA